MYITDSESLRVFCRSASAAKVIAVDTEFVRERTYYPQLCLVQVATHEASAVVDALLVDDLAPLGELLLDESVTKVFHACAQDLEVLYGTFGRVPRPIFDTQLAASFLGSRLQLGYGALVQEYRGVHLAKADSLTDWAKRPLDEEQLVYAEDDVVYLPPIYDQMVGELTKRDRLSWVIPEMEALCDEGRYAHEPREAYVHLKRSSSLTRRQLAVAREVCAWREQTAAQRNLPRRWVVSDEVLVELCRGLPRTVQRLRRTRGTESLNDRDAQGLVDAVACGMACDPDDYPPLRHHERPSQDAESVLDLMYAVLRIVSDREGIAPQLIASRDDLYAFMRRKEGRLAAGWRYDLCGRELERLLAGSLGLTVKAGRVELL